MSPSIRWDLFCRVVDNFGDAGVCWRLARQLAHEHGLAVTLWIDDVRTLARIAPALVPDRDDQGACGVRVRALTDAAAATAPPADVVIEGFGCGLPEAYVANMAAAARAPAWVVLEYLSAEPWIDASHGLPSPHPQYPLMRTFWFPGFTPRSGGLLREAGLRDRREMATAQAATRTALLRAAGVDAPAAATLVSLFCYANPVLPGLLDAWAEGDAAVVCLVPEGIALSELDRFTGGAVPHSGQACTRGALSIAVMPMVDQDTFDERLWQCDLNFVRGEDSLVRAVWAGRPLVWQLYPQDEDAHLAKMDAFLTRYEAGMPESVRAVQRAFWYGWNDGNADMVVSAWPALRAALPALRRHGNAWAEHLAAGTDLATLLVNHCENRL
jgi:uncharacterized repeat protein (TIGR03837 family)